MIRILIKEVETVKSYGLLTEKLSWLFLEWRRYLQKGLLSYDITLQQMSLLHRLDKKESMLPNEIADYLHCDRPTASVILRNLEKKEYILRRKDPVNAKYHHIAISDKGKKFLELLSSSMPRVTVSPFDVLTPEENEQLYYLLTKCCDRTKDIIHLNQKEKKSERYNKYDL